ncbi:MAG: CRTAC1 family protein, partial [Acidobacteriota bacterium]|nr:CRTAC1 family protein [Acidobacteriota bacterium]
MKFAAVVVVGSVLGLGATIRAAGEPQFTDVTTAAGIRFRHNSGAEGKKFLPETLGSGVAFLDIDDDGWQDIFFVNSRNWPGREGAPSYPALYR